jgi:hypothetical protein
MDIDCQTCEKTMKRNDVKEHDMKSCFDYMKNKYTTQDKEISDMTQEISKLKEGFGSGLGLGRSYDRLQSMVFENMI